MARRVVDAHGMLLFPGVIDPHVHFGLRSRGTVTADDFVIGSLCAAEGGVTTVIDYADHLPGASLASARARMGNTGAVLRGLDAAPERGAVDRTCGSSSSWGSWGLQCEVFTTQEAGYAGREGSRRWSRAAQAGLLVTVHAETTKLARYAGGGGGRGDVARAHGRSAGVWGRGGGRGARDRDRGEAEGPVYSCTCRQPGGAGHRRSEGRGRRCSRRRVRYLLLDESAYAGAEARDSS